MTLTTITKVKALNAVMAGAVRSDDDPASQREHEAGGEPPLRNSQETSDAPKAYWIFRSGFVTFQIAARCHRRIAHSLSSASPFAAPEGWSQRVL